MEGFSGWVRKKDGVGTRMDEGGLVKDCMWFWVGSCLVAVWLGMGWFRCRLVEVGLLS